MPPTTKTIYDILNYNFGKQTPVYGPNTTMYFGLSTTEVDETGLASVTEPAAAADYARVTYTNNTTNWSTANATNGAVVRNNNPVTFTTSSSTSAWGTILSIFMADTSTRAAGNILWYYTLEPSLVVGTSTVVDFAINTIVVT
jgi:hypothetical protein